MRSVRPVVLVVGLAVAAAAAGLSTWLCVRHHDSAFVYTWRVEYGRKPPADNALADWLKAQPRVTGVSVTREGNALLVTYEAPADRPPVEVLDRAAALGYADRGSFNAEFHNR